ncbi:MAG: sigma-70 family RNA polymerase sigma factor [Clostridium sp.]|nr:sigma-70 family RNA polymerase sigma factor [Clostridium sp.]
MEDEKIVQLYFNRDENAIKCTADKYSSKLCNISYRIVRDTCTVQECENDTYMETWKRIPPSNPKDYFFAFLARIIRTISIDRYRKETSLKRNCNIVELSKELDNCIPAIDSVESEIEAKLLGEMVSRFLYTLSDEKQIMFVRRYFYMESIAEIAKHLSITESKVKTSLFRVRGKLKIYLDKEEFL